MNRRGGRLAWAVLAIVLIISGGYKIYKGLVYEDPISSGVMNEWVSDKNGVEFCITNVENVKSVGNEWGEVTTDNNFVVVTIQITNNSNEPYSVNGSRFLLMTGEAEYEYTVDVLFAFDNALYIDTINPGLSEEYVIVYETPSTTDESEYKMKVKPNGLSDKVSAYIELK